MFGRALVLGAAGVAMVATAAPAGDIDISLKHSLCDAVHAPFLYLDVDAAPSGTGFIATATATLCNATAIVTAVQMQFAGAGASTAPPGGGPIAGAPFAVSYSNSATVSGTSAAPSGLAQTVAVDVTAQSLTWGTQHVASCQGVVHLAAGRRVRVLGC